MSASTGADTNYRDPFFTVPSRQLVTAAGEVSLPVFYYEASNFVALFRSDAAEVRRQLQGTGLEPALTLAGKPITVVSCYEYRATSIGAYNEVGVAILVCPEGETRGFKGWIDLFKSADARELGAYIVDLPVTTTLACCAGKELWGYPKFVTPISYRQSRCAFRCEVADPEHNVPIMTLSGNTRTLLPWLSMDVPIFSFRKGIALRTHVNVRGGNWIRTAHSLRLSVGSSMHPMAQRLRALGLDGATPVAVMSTDRFQSRLNEGAPTNF